MIISEHLATGIDNIYNDCTLCDHSKAIFDFVSDGILKGRFSEDDLLAFISKEKNSIDSRTITMLLDNGILSYEELISVGVPTTVIDFLLHRQRKSFWFVRQPIDFKDLLDHSSTEIYVWGMPCSGKSSFLATLLSYASKSIRYITEDTNGFEHLMHYMHFCHYEKQETCAFPTAGCPFEPQIMKLSLFKEGNNHSKKLVLPLTFIETNSDSILCMHNKSIGIPLPDREERQYQIFNEHFSNGINRNIHVLCLPVIPPSWTINGIDYGSYVANFLKVMDSQKYLWRKCNAFIILLTKSDTRSTIGGFDAEEIFRENYEELYHSVNCSCKKFEIQLYVKPYSVGDSYFQDLFVPNAQSAKEVLNLIISRSTPKRNRWWTTWPGFGWFK